MSSKPMWTPGPWTIERYDTWDKDIRITEPGVKVDHDDVDHAEAEANATLIAAAPGLYEALKRAEELLSVCQPHDEKLVADVRAALDRAVGSGK